MLLPSLPLCIFLILPSYLQVFSGWGMDKPNGELDCPSKFFLSVVGCLHQFALFPLHQIQLDFTVWSCSAICCCLSSAVLQSSSLIVNFRLFNFELRGFQWVPEVSCIYDPLIIDLIICMDLLEFGFLSRSMTNGSIDLFRLYKKTSTHFVQHWMARLNHLILLHTKTIVEHIPFILSGNLCSCRCVTSLPTCYKQWKICWAVRRHGQDLGDLMV